MVVRPNIYKDYPPEFPIWFYNRMRPHYNADRKWMSYVKWFDDELFTWKPVDPPEPCTECAEAIGKPFRITPFFGAPIILPNGYGLVLSMGLASVACMSYFQIKQSFARRTFQVPSPLTYSPEHMEWNTCYRPVSATLENYPQFLFMLLIGGLEMPYWCAFAGFMWCCGRVSYAWHCYEQPTPFNHRSGNYWVFANILLMMATVKYTFKKMVF